MIEYKGYTGVFEFDPSIDAFHGRIVGLQDVVTFLGGGNPHLCSEGEASGLRGTAGHQEEAWRKKTKGLSRLMVPGPVAAL